MMWAMGARVFCNVIAISNDSCRVCSCETQPVDWDAKLDPRSTWGEGASDDDEGKEEDESARASSTWC